MQIEMKKAEVVILRSDKIDFKTEAIIREKEGHYVMIKEEISKRIYNL